MLVRYMAAIVARGFSLSSLTHLSYLCHETFVGAAVLRALRIVVCLRQQWHSVVGLSVRIAAKDHCECHSCSALSLAAATPKYCAQTVASAGEPQIVTTCVAPAYYDRFCCDLLGLRKTAFWFFCPFSHARPERHVAFLCLRMHVMLNS